jgi:hypothetical protein
MRGTYSEGPYEAWMMCLAIRITVAKHVWLNSAYIDVHDILIILILAMQQVDSHKQPWCRIWYDETHLGQFIYMA